MTTGSGLFSNKGPAQGRFIEGKSGVAGEVNDLRQDVKSTLMGLAAITVEEFTNVTAGGAAVLQAATATTVAPRTVLRAGMLAPGLATLAQYPRTVTITTAGTTASDAPASAVITGVFNGAPQSETVVVPQTATVVESVKAYSDLVSVAYAAADGTGATNSIGVGNKLGLSKKLKSRAGVASLLKEHAVGAVVTNGVLTAVETSAPNGLYTPNSVPNGTNDYAIYYEFDPTA